MGQPPLVSSRDVVIALCKVGFAHVRTKGSHHVLVRQDPAATIVVPERQEVPRGTLRSILRVAGLSVEEFVALLGR